MSKESPISSSPFSRLRPSKTGTNSTTQSSTSSPYDSRLQKASLSSTLNEDVQEHENKREASKALPQVPNNNAYGLNLNDLEKKDIQPETTPLQDLFGIKNETNSPKAIISNKNVSTPRIITSTASKQNLSNEQEMEQTNEERNQMTVQTAITDFEMPLPARTKLLNSNLPPSPEPENTRLRKILLFFKKGRHSINPIIFKRIIKSSIAFFLATLLVIIDPVRDVLGNGSYTAIIATIIFDSCRTVGAQLESTLLTCICSLIGLLIYITAFGFYILFNKNNVIRDNDNSVILDGSFILALFLYTYMFISGIIKTKFPKLTGPITLLNVIMLISLTQIPFGSDVFTLTTFGLILSPSLIGVGISTFVNVTLWPESASQDLGDSLVLTLESLHSTLNLLSDSFLLKDDTLSITPHDLEILHSRSITAVTALVKAGREARYEYAYSIHPPNDYKTLINLSLLLQQHLGGLNLAVQRQRQLLGLRKTDSEDISPVTTRSNSPTEIKAFSLPPSPSALSLSKLGGEIMPITPEIDPILARDLIHDILHIVSAPLAKMSEVCSEAIGLAKELLINESEIKSKTEEEKPKHCCHCAALKEFSEEECPHNLQNEKSKKPEDLKDMIVKLKEATLEFELAEGRCLKLIHKQVLFTPHLHAPFPEPMLVVFSGIFSIREFSKSITNFLEKEETFLSLRPYISKRSGFLGTGPSTLSKQKRWWRPNITWVKWLKGNRLSEDPQQYESNDTTDNSLKDVNSQYEKNKREAEKEDEEHANDPIALPAQRWIKPEYHTRNAFKSVSKPSKFKKLIISLKFNIWKASQAFNTFEVKFAVKLVLVVILLSFPAYVPKFSSYYTSVRGPWGAIAAMLIMNQTIGGTLKLGIIRLIGTIIGAIWGYLTFLVSNNTQNVCLVIVMIWVYAVPSWYFMVTTSYSRIGFNGLIAYVVILFVSYKSTKLDEVLIIALLRTASVVVGLIVSMVVSSTIWPFSARRELRKLIASLLADMGMSFGKVAALCMSSNTTTEWKELQSQINLCNRKLQKRILSAKSLHLFALDEPRLKGPFQAPVYSEQIRILQDVLDQLVAMTGAVSQLTPDVQKTVIFPFNSYRKFMVSSVILYFYVLSGALRSKMPLPPYPPPIHAIRYQLMLKTRSALVKKFKKNSYNTLPLHKSILERSDEFRNEAVGSHLELNTTLSFDQKNLHEEFNHIYWYTYMAGVARLFEGVELLGHNIAGLVGETSIPVKEHIVTFPDDDEDDD